MEIFIHVQLYTIMNYEFIKELNEKYGLTVIVIEQKIRLLCEYAKKLAVLKHGDKSAVLKAKRQRTAFLRQNADVAVAK